MTLKKCSLNTFVDTCGGGRYLSKFKFEVILMVVFQTQFIETLRYRFLTNTFTRRFYNAISLSTLMAAVWSNITKFSITPDSDSFKAAFLLQLLLVVSQHASACKAGRQYINYSCVQLSCNFMQMNLPGCVENHP